MKVVAPAAQRFRPQARPPRQARGAVLGRLPDGGSVLEVVAIFLTVAWLLGVLAGYTWDGAIHGLVLLAAIAVAVRVASSGDTS